jgi:hypothetical protein
LLSHRTSHLLCFRHYAFKAVSDCLQSIIDDLLNVVTAPHAAAVSRLLLLCLSLSQLNCCICNVACLQSIIHDLLNAALAHIAMRPTKQQVAVEVAEWKAARPAALAGISRHVADRCGIATA